MHTVNFLTHLLVTHQLLVYLLIFLGIILEGEFVLLCAGILVHLGALNFYSTLVFVLIGGFCKTFLGYQLGKFIHDKWHKSKFLRYIEKRVHIIMPHFARRPFWSIFISKFIMVNHIVIIFAGYKKINFKKYLQAEVLSTLVWAPLLLLLGYLFSYAALYVSHEIWRFSMIVLVLMIAFILFDRLMSWIYELFEELYSDEEPQ